MYFCERQPPMKTLLVIALALITICYGSQIPQTLPFVQSWNASSYVLSTDDWSAVPGIVGYRGTNLTNTAGVDPQTTLEDPSSTTQSAVVGQTDPNNSTNGGVAEFVIADRVVALLATPTDNAPSLLIYLNTTGFTDIHVTYVLRDLDTTTNDAVQPVALQYRVGGSGNFTNVPNAFVADATRGPSLDNVVNVSVTLPAAAANQSLLILRILTTDAVGDDEWVGIDDIAIAGTDIGSSTTLVATTGVHYYEESSSGVGTKDKLIGILVPLILCLVIVGSLATLFIVKKKCKKSNSDDENQESNEIEL